MQLRVGVSILVGLGNSAVWMRIVEVVAVDLDVVSQPSSLDEEELWSLRKDMDMQCRKSLDCAYYSRLL